jgi:hypothetical protein
MPDQQPFSPLGLGERERYLAVFKKIEDGSITALSNDGLIEAARVLSTYHAEGAGQDQAAAALLVHSMLLERTVKEVEKTMLKIDQSNAATQRLVVVLSIIAIGVGVAQVIVAVLPLLCGAGR